MFFQAASPPRGELPYYKGFAKISASQLSGLVPSGFAFEQLWSLHLAGTTG
jgi:hypothetical protein